MIRVTRYDCMGKLFHTCLTEEATLDTHTNGHLFVDMPMRFWWMVPGGTIDIHVEDNREDPL